MGAPTLTLLLGGVNPLTQMLAAPNLVDLWLAKPANVTQAGGVVSAWTGYKGNVWSAAGTAKPAYTTNGYVTGQDALVWDGADDIMEVGGNLFLAKTGRTILIAIKAALAGSVAVIVEYTTNPANLGGFNLASLAAGATNINTVDSAVATAPLIELWGSSGAVDCSAGVVLTSCGSCNLAAGSNTLPVERNGTPIAGTNIPAAIAGNYAAGSVFLGARSGGTLPCAMSVAGIALASSSYSAGDRATYEGLLKTLTLTP